MIQLTLSRVPNPRVAIPAAGQTWKGMPRSRSQPRTDPTLAGASSKVRKKETSAASLPAAASARPTNGPRSKAWEIWARKTAPATPCRR